MITGIALALGAVALALVLARVGTVAYGLLYLSFLPFMTLDPSQGGLVSVDGLASGDNVLFKLGARALTACAVLALAARRARSVIDVATRPACLPVLLFFGWALLGLPRCQDPWVSFFRLGELLVFFLTGVLLYVESGRDGRGADVLRWHALATVPLLVVTVAFALLHPEIAFHGDPGGARRMGHKFMNSNVLGFAATVVALWGVWVLSVRERRRRRGELLLALVMLLLAGFVLYHARSRTATLTTLCAVGVLLAPWPHPDEDVAARRARARTFAGTLVAVALVALPFAGPLEGWFLRGASAAEVASGTGRTGLWAELLALQVPEAPLLGAGYLNLSAAGGFEHAGHHWNNAHSTYLFALVSTGVPGLLCVLLIVGLPLVHAARRVLLGDLAERPEWTLALAFTVVVATASVTSFGVTGYPNVAMLFHYALLPWVTRPWTSPAPRRGARPAACTRRGAVLAPQGGAR